MRIALTLVAAVVAVTSPARAQGSPSSDQEVLAQRHFERGTEAFDAGRHEEALSAFRASFELVSSPNTSLYIARALARLDDIGEAVAAYEAAIRLARLRVEQEPRYQRTEDAARQELSRLEPQVGHVVPEGSVPEGTLIVVAGRNVPPEAVGLPRPVTPGAITIEVTPPGANAAVREVVDVVARQRVVVDLDALVARAPPPRVPNATPTPTPTPTPTTPTDAPGRSGALLAATVGSGVVTVTGWVLAAVFGLNALVIHDELVTRCGDAACPEEQAQIDEGRRSQTISNVGIVVGASGAALTALFLALWLASGGDAEDDAPVAVGPTSIRLRF
jgi:hypothetical protein